MASPLSALYQINETLWEIPRTFHPNMRVPARLYASQKLLKEITTDTSLQQLVNVACLPGIQHYALAMPDIHEGYGFPIGGVAAFSTTNGIISPGGIGYDINCGVRLLRSTKKLADIQQQLNTLGEKLLRLVPSGVGQGGTLKLSPNDMRDVLMHGAQWAVQKGYGTAHDLEHTESQGRLVEADASTVSHRAVKRGADQLGTMGAGNHFVEVQIVETIYDEHAAQTLGLFQDQVVVMQHMGSRGLGHQVATDHIRTMLAVAPHYKVTLPDRELACVPFNTPEGHNYWKAMCAAANFAWANRQLITSEVRTAWREAIGESELELVYDVAHNIAKIEGKLLVHRKGATRSFPNQPVFIPGSMGTYSYVLMGQQKALEVSFGSACHGAGRRMSRSGAKRSISREALAAQLRDYNVITKTPSPSSLSEEAPQAYKDVNEVVAVVDSAGLAKKVARCRPVVVVKG